MEIGINLAAKSYYANDEMISLIEKGKRFIEWKLQVKNNGEKNKELSTIFGRKEIILTT